MYVEPCLSLQCGVVVGVDTDKPALCVCSKPNPYNQSSAIAEKHARYQQERGTFICRLGHALRMLGWGSKGGGAGRQDQRGVRRSQFDAREKQFTSYLLVLIYWRKFRDRKRKPKYMYWNWD